MWWEKRDYVWYVRHGKKSFFYRTHFFSYPPPLGGVTPEKNIPPGIKQNFLPPPPLTSPKGEKDIWWTAGTTRGGVGHLGLTRTETHSEAGYRRPVDRGAWTAKTVKRPQQQPAHLQYANYWAPLTRKRHILPHPAQPHHTNHWAPRTRKRHQQEHRPQRPTESSNPTQHAKGRTGDCPGPVKEQQPDGMSHRGGRQEKGPPTKPGWAEPRMTARSWCSVNHPGHHAEQGTWGSRTQKRSEAGCGRPEDGAVTAKTVKRPQQQPAQPQCANYWAPLTRKRHILPHPAQPQHTNHWAPRMRK